MLTGLVDKGVELTIMTFKENDLTRSLEEKGLKFIYHHPAKKISFKSISIIRKTLKEGNYDILHLYNGKALTNALFASWNIPVKIIAYYGSMKLYWHDITAYISYLNPRIKKIICISDAVRDHVRKQLPPKSREKAIRIYKGYSHDWTKKIKPVSRDELGIPDDAFVIGCVAGVRRIKGVPLLIKALNHIPSGLPVYIILIGYKIDHPDHMKLIEKSRYKDNFRVLGRKPDATVFIASCDIYVQPSLSEGLGRAIIEAMLLEIPPVVTDIGGAKELIISGESGMTIKARSVEQIAGAISELIKEKDSLKEKGRKARQRIIERFNVRNSIDQTFDLYKDVYNND